MRKSIFVWSVLLFCACQSEEGGNKFKTQERKDIVLTRGEQDMVEEGNYFAFNLLKVVEQNETKENYFISPLSASLALSMTTNGAGSSTLSEMKQVLGFDAYTVDEMNTFYKKLVNELLKVDNSTELGIANSIWVKEGFPVLSSFKEVNRTMYDAQVEELNFDSPNAVKTINQWCADQTNGRIDKMLDQIPEMARMYLLNALYFKGIWNAKFEKKNTSKSDFTNSDGSKKKVDMMKQEHLFPYITDMDLQIAEFSYGNEAFSMVVLLPEDNQTPEQVIAGLTVEKWTEWMDKLLGRESTLDVRFPKFKMEYSRELNDDLIELGMQKAFDPNKADFSKMSDLRLFISMVKQNSFVEVNEEGTEAAAVTIVEMEYTSAAPPQVIPFHMNRPFVYIIKEKSTGAILFIGKMGKM